MNLFRVAAAFLSAALFVLPSTAAAAAPEPVALLLPLSSLT